MTDRPALSRGELEIARILWGLKQATVRQVHDAATKRRDIDFATVQTYLRRLEKKGYVRASLEGRSCVYSTKIRPHTVIRDTIDDLIDRLFAGDTMPLMRHLVVDRGISTEDLAELRRLLDELEKDQT